MLVAGLDIGSRTTKAVILDTQLQVLSSARVRTRPNFEALAEEALSEVLSAVGAARGDLDYMATTGFGRYNVAARDLQVTDITAAARGAAYLFPGTRTVLDIGAQNSRAIRIEAGGRVKEFKSNDKCAAGAGGFVERAAKYLELNLEEVGRLSLESDQALTISSVCAVLAESEIINHVTGGQKVENIVRGVHDSLAGRALALLKRVGMEPEITFVGGATRQAGMVLALSNAVGMPVNSSEDSDLAGAIGAALLGIVRLQKLGVLPAEASQPAVVSPTVEQSRSGNTVTSSI